MTVAAVIIVATAFTASVRAEEDEPSISAKAELRAIEEFTLDDDEDDWIAKHAFLDLEAMNGSTEPQWDTI